MTPMTPSGVATRSIRRPFGRSKVASMRPTGSGRAATSSRPRAIASMRASSSVSRSMKAALRPLAPAFGEIAGVGGEDVADALAQGARRGGQRAVLLLGRGVGEHARGRPRLEADAAHGGANVGFGLQNLNGGGHGASRRADSASCRAGWAERLSFPVIDAGDRRKRRLRLLFATPQGEIPND